MMKIYIFLQFVFVSPLFLVFRFFFLSTCPLLYFLPIFSYIKQHKTKNIHLRLLRRCIFLYALLILYISHFHHQTNKQTKKKYEPHANIQKKKKNTQPLESLSDDFLFPMTTSRLSYASSPESDLEMGSGPTSSLSLGNLPQLVKASSDPSIATNQDNLERDVELNNLGDGLMMPPPYTVRFFKILTTTINKMNFFDSN